jgi:hypothetical protein
MSLYLSPEPEASTILLVDGRSGWFDAKPSADGLIVHISAYTKSRLEGAADLDRDISVRLITSGGPLSVADVTLHGQTAAQHPDLIAWTLQALGDADLDGVIDQAALLNTLEKRLHAGLPSSLTDETGLLRRR